MPKKQAAKKTAKKKDSASKPCNLKNICDYIEKLYQWTLDMEADYKKVRIALCNVEKQAFTGNGNPNRPPRFCTGGGGNEPADPPKPPDW